MGDRGMISVEIGDVVFSGKRKKTLFSRGVMWFTNSRWSHCFFIMTDVAGERAVLEADLNCHVVPWCREYETNDNDYYEVYRPMKVSSEEIIKAANETYQEFSGEIYGFGQIIWFMWDAFCEKVGLNSGKQWFSDGIVCSGVLDAYIQRLNPLFQDAFKEYNIINRVNPEQLYKVVKSRPDLFEFIGERK